MADVTMSDRDVQDLGAFRHLASSPAELSKKIADLERDSQKQRDEIREFKEKVKAVPAEGAVVLTGDDATEYAAWKALDVKAADVAKLKTDNEALAAEKAKRDRKDALVAARTTEGWNEQAPDVLMALAGFEALELTQGDVTVERTVNGKKESVKEKTAFVTVDGKSVRISEWVKGAQPVIATLLTANTNGTGNGGAGNGVLVPDMRGASGGERKITEADVRASAERTVDYTL